MLISSILPLKDKASNQIIFAVLAENNYDA
jgi:hypothetical protein